MKILLVYCLHGDELITESVAEEMQSKYGVDILLGNPKARKFNKRFIGSDLNRSFRISKTYEGRRAKRIKAKLLNHDYNLIIDMHTTTAKTPPFLIITELSKLKLLGKCGLKNILYVTKEFSKGRSFIENIENSFSIEVEASLNGRKALTMVIKNIIEGESKIIDYNLFCMENIIKGPIRNDVANMKRLQNGLYAFFAGEISYKGISYFEARKYTLRT